MIWATTDNYDYAEKFQRGDRVYCDTKSEHRFYGTVIKRLQRNRVLVDDGKGLTPRVLSAERLRFNVQSGRPRAGGAAA